MESTVEEFLVSALPAVRQELGTRAWFALRFGRGEYGIFDAFTDEAGRDAHLAGSVAASLMARSGELFVKAPRIERIDVLASKIPAAVPALAAGKGLLLSFKAKTGQDAQVEQFLREARNYVMDETGTTSWFALRFPDGDYGIFDVFPDNGARFMHLVGHVPRELAKHALSLLGSMPDMHLLNVLAESCQG
jgi:quinol monooxygenase YgiN